MKNKDLLRVCMQNLYRHKGRTLLTVLGVMIGCCSVIIMISIGIGMKESQEKMLSRMGDLTLIEVYKTGNSIHAAKLNRQATRSIKQLSGVETATPKITMDLSDAKIYAGTDRRYSSSMITLVGIDIEAAQKIGYELDDGGWNLSGQNHVLIGKNTAYWFEDSKRPEGRNMAEMPRMEVEEDGANISQKTYAPYFDELKTPLYLELGDGKEGGKKQTIQLTVDGRLKENYGKGAETSMGILFRLEDMENIRKAQKRLSGVKYDPDEGYDSAIVKVTGIDQVQSVESEIKKMGFRTNSMESIRKPMEQEARQKQMMLGGLGAVSLFVAALGITNTMIMSITERTREIGVMKALGCYVRDIRRIFLLEAGGIGLMGGMFGMAVSLLISIIMNTVGQLGGGSMNGEMGAAWMETGSAEGVGRLSVIPWWLGVAGVLFSVLIGVVSGYYPADKAVKIPALEAIKHD